MVMRRSSLQFLPRDLRRDDHFVERGKLFGKDWTVTQMFPCQTFDTLRLGEITPLRLQNSNFVRGAINHTFEVADLLVELACIVFQGIKREHRKNGRHPNRGYDEIPHVPAPLYASRIANTAVCEEADIYRTIVSTLGRPRPLRSSGCAGASVRVPALKVADRARAAEQAGRDPDSVRVWSEKPGS